MEFSNKQMRERREFENLFSNPKNARAMWQKNVAVAYARPVVEPMVIFDRDGNPTEESQIEIKIFEHLVAELRAQGHERYPTEGEFMEACQQYYARHNASAYTARRDSMGAKPVDETKQQVIVNNPLEGLTDEELLVMQQALDDLHARQQLTEGGTADVRCSETDNSCTEPCNKQGDSQGNSATDNGIGCITCND